MSLTDEVQQLADYLNISIKSLNNSIGASNKRAAAQPDGQLINTLQSQTSTNTQNQLKQNPLFNAATDSVNQITTTVVQQTVGNAIKKVNLTPIQNATQQFFTLFASVTSFGTEVAMALARNSGNNLINAIKEKDALNKQLQDQVTALYNACAIMLNGQPFFDSYLTAVTQAFILMTQADKSLQSVVAKLQPTALPSPTYNALQFNQSITKLTQARDLLLPDRGADVSSISAVGGLVSSTLARQSNINTFAAALAIPGISLQVATLALKYELAVINVNAYVNSFTGALSDYITGYTQSNSVNQATIDHINSGISQLEDLLASMNAILSTNTGSSTDLSFRFNLSTQGTIWGVTLTAIIEWLKINPGAGSALLTQTSNSVAAYTKAQETIQDLSDRNFSGGTVFVDEGKEDALKGLVKPLAQFMTTANTLLTLSISRNDVHAQASKVLNYLKTAQQIDNQIVAAVQPFLNTTTTLSGDVNKGVNQLIGFSNKLGLDRVAGLLTAGAIPDLFSVTPDTATYSGAAVSGLNSIISNMGALPEVTSQQLGALESLRDQVQRQQAAQQTYAGRSASATQKADIAQQQNLVNTNKTLVQTATTAATQVDSTVGQDPGAQTQQLLGSKVTPGQMPTVADTNAQLKSARN